MHFRSNPVFYRLLLLLAIVGVQSCVSSSPLIRPGTATQTIAQKRVLLMPMSVSVSEVSTGGVTVPKAKWTADVRKNIREQLKSLFNEMESELVFFPQAPLPPPLQAKVDHVVQLHEVVGETILRYKYARNQRLKAKEKNFDWTVGEYTRFLADRYDADYVLFVSVRDSYASAGLKGVSLLFTVLYAFPMIPQNTGRVGYASIVDAQTGNIVWFNYMTSKIGDLRSPNRAKATVARLMKDSAELQHSSQ